MSILLKISLSILVALLLTFKIIDSSELKNFDTDDHDKAKFFLAVVGVVFVGMLAITYMVLSFLEGTFFTEDTPKIEETPPAIQQQAEQPKPTENIDLMGIIKKSK